ncbi:enoyl-CoA hydratase, partial [Pseudomonas sp. FW306-2-11BA]|uniref:enoyl-CoA hydratase/isomerase family protein n=1 Tax=Pseudomonas sp. FW306-2-11BA TaxID=2070662 RepID=UPI000CB0645B
GQYLALTGYRADGAECHALGLATHYLPSAALDEAKTRITANPAIIEQILAELAASVPGAKVLAHREAIERLFAADKLEAVLTALEADRSDW